MKGWDLTGSYLIGLFLRNLGQRFKGLRQSVAQVSD